MYLFRLKHIWRIKPIGSKALKFRPTRVRVCILLREVIRIRVKMDLARVCRHPHAGDRVISGWHPGTPPLSFAVENGAHAETPSS
jgi:hypothetical protein